jgi:triosephosphate isomerase (TIM)
VPRRAVIAGNWKMHGTVSESRALLRGLRARLTAHEPNREVVVAPPYTALGAAAEELRGSPIELAAQNVHWESRGAFTGEISAAMLLEAGCRWAIVGHSERRQLFGETDANVNRRARAALEAGLLPIVCVGETLAERQANHTMDVVARQVRAALLDLRPADIQTLCIAYEPVWAIGTGQTATPDQAEEVHAELRRIVAEVAGAQAAERLRILYGGSVKPDNIDSLMAEPDIDGALVGGASLEVESFARIVEFQA